MRPSTTLSFIGFSNLLVGSFWLLYGLFVRLFLVYPPLNTNPVIQRTIASFPLFEQVLHSPAYAQWLWWTSGTDLATTLALLAAGYGLYSQQPWAHRLTLIGASYIFVRSILKLLLMLWFIADSGLSYAFTFSSFGIEITYPVLVYLIINRPVVIEGLRDGVRERAATPSLRALSERHKRASTLPPD